MQRVLAGRLAPAGLSGEVARQASADNQRSYAKSLPDRRFEGADSAHFIHAEQPQLVAERARQLLGLPPDMPHKWTNGELA